MSSLREQAIAADRAVVQYLARKEQNAALLLKLMQRADAAANEYRRSLIIDNSRRKG